MREGGLPGDDDSPEPSTEKVAGTTRKCANCGQVGHIKTNKKYVCPCSGKKAPRPHNKAVSDGTKHSKLRKRDGWRPTQNPRMGDKFWDPRRWDKRSFEDNMELHPPSKDKAKHVTWEDVENWGSGDE